MIYEVGIRWEAGRINIEAQNSTEAKRKFCKLKGRKYNDPWSGAGILSARKLNVSESVKEQPKVVRNSSRKSPLFASGRDILVPWRIE
ncbi:hypothetical protein [Paenibacillus ihumii]|uniref:hypothetical protein n=1 Tax=Paenibacillus ihumii TaxID=687436 RepID=UPI0006D7F016|nr:hypothetical protein [Paenibacillus ihumii]